MTLADMIADVYSRLNEPRNSAAGALLAGTGNADAPAVAADAQVTAYLNDGLDDLARACSPLPAYGLAEVAPGTQSLPLSSLGAAGGRALWHVRALLWGGAPLTQASRTALDRYRAGRASEPPATPRYWYQDGEGALGLYPAPAAAGQVLADGFGLPTPLAAPSDAPGWLAADLHKLAVFYACVQLARKNADDNPLAVRLPVWEAAYAEGVAQQRARLSQADRALMALVVPPQAE